MYQEISKLLMYGDLPQDEILYKLGQLFEQFEVGEYNKTELVRDINTQVKRILKVATDYGFDDNLWHNYLTFFLMMSENPFSITCEKVGASDGSVNGLVANDFRIFKKLFDYDFKPIGFYKAYGVGMFGLNKAFRIEEHLDGGFSFMPINNMDAVMLDDLIGYEIQKKKLTDNTEAFVQGKKANNVLLFGDSGTGKSTSIKAIVNQYYDDGLRMIEIYKHQFKYLSKIIAAIKNRNYRFIIYMDDLSFEEHEIEYKFLKAVIEGGVETKPDNILIYATSNRRHLIKETWNDRNDQDNSNDKHHSDTVEEKLSLVNRFGVTISYSKPSQKEFFNIVTELARKSGCTLSDEELCREANKWELSHGGISGRTATQFVNYIMASN